MLQVIPSCFKKRESGQNQYGVAINEKRSEFPLQPENKNWKSETPKGTLHNFFQKWEISKHLSSGPSVSYDDIIISTPSSNCPSTESNDDVIISTSNTSAYPMQANFEETNSREVQLCEEAHSSLTSSVLAARCIKQGEIKRDINSLNGDLVALLNREKLDTLTPELKLEFKKKRNRCTELNKMLKRLEYKRKKASEYRKDKKLKLQQMILKDKSIRKVLNIRKKVGRPAITEDHPELLETIAALVLHGSLADSRRQSESIRTIRTLSQLTEELQLAGFVISRSATYYHLLPANPRAADGKRHMKSAPVRLIRATNDLHTSHVDSEFARATIDHLKELASLLGPNEVAVISQDDKCRVPMGTTAATAQQPILMNMEYKVKLHDHNFPVADRHKLVPSVYAGLIVKPDGFGAKNAVSYSGKLTNFSNFSRVIHH